MKLLDNEFKTLGQKLLTNVICLSPVLNNIDSYFQLIKLKMPKTHLVERFTNKWTLWLTVWICYLRGLDSKAIKQTEGILLFPFHRSSFKLKMRRGWQVDEFIGKPSPPFHAKPRLIPHFKYSSVRTCLALSLSLYITTGEYEIQYFRVANKEEELFSSDGELGVISFPIYFQF